MKRALCVLALLTAGWGGCPSDYAEPYPPTAEQHRVKTADGWEIALVHYRPVGTPKGRPILVCHGISANDRSVDLDQAHSLARWLASQGRDTWTMSLRGTGASDRADPDQHRPDDYGFDVFWREDLPAAVAFVRQATGAPAIDYVGHSMGGMILYAYLAEGGEGIAAAVTLGSPTRLDWSSTLAPFLFRGSQALLAATRDVPVVTPAHLVMPLHGEIPGSPIDLALYNPENMGKQTWKRLIAIGIADIAGGVARQMLGFIRTGHFESADGKIDYRKDMARIRTPVLVVAGKLDRLALPIAVKDGYRALGGPKAWLLVGEENGAKADYGHMDLVLGDRAAAEVWAPALAFLDSTLKPVVSATGQP